MGRGIEGCGVTKFSIELEKFFEKKGMPYRSFAFTDKKWTRGKSHTGHNICDVKLEEEKEFNEFISSLKENAKYLIINSLPSSGHSDLFKKRFKQILDVGIKTILFQHDHSRMSIQRNACLDDAIERADVCLSHSSKNYFSEYINKKYNENSLSAFFDDDDTASSKKLMTFQPAFDFDECRANYWKPIEEQDPKHHKWIGRTAHWKGFRLMLDWHNTKLQPNNCLTTMEGIETSIVYPDFLIISPHNNFVKPFTPATQDVFDKHNLTEEYKNQYQWNGTKKIDTVDLSSYYGTGACVFGIYNNTDMLNRMSKSGFGYQLTLLNSENVEKSIEYTHCEVVATGTIPVFHRKFGELCHHRVSGTPLAKSKDSGTIWLDEKSYDECIDLIKKLEADDVMRNEWREMAFEFYKTHQDSDFVFKDIFKEIL